MGSPESRPAKPNVTETKEQLLAQKGAVIDKLVAGGFASDIRLADSQSKEKSKSIGCILTLGVGEDDGYQWLILFKEPLGTNRLMTLWPNDQEEAMQTMAGRMSSTVVLETESPAMDIIYDSLFIEREGMEYAGRVITNAEDDRISSIVDLKNVSPEAQRLLEDLPLTPKKSPPSSKQEPGRTTTALRDISEFL